MYLGMTPAEILFGNAVDLDRRIFLPKAPIDEEGKEIRAYYRHNEIC